MQRFTTRSIPTIEQNWRSIAHQVPAFTDATTMGTLAFFPWAAIRAPLSVGGYELLPFKRREAPAGKGEPKQAIIDALLESYRTAPKGPVHTGTILRPAGKELLADISDEEADEALRFGELVAFSGLSARRFFDNFGYANRDNFRLIVQRFTDPTSGMLVASRRRDGSQRTIVTKSAMLNLKPYHVSTTSLDGLDVALLGALVDRSQRGDWGEIEEGILGFNAANTDSPDILGETEAVSLVGAFERALGLDRGREEELAEGFLRTVASGTTLAPNACERVTTSTRRLAFIEYETMREAWIRDFFRLRGDHAHGKIAPSYTSLWSVREHLLIGSFVFPLLVKGRLVAEGGYKWSEEDLVHLEALDALICARHFDVRDDTDEEQDVQYPWSRIMDQANTEIRIKRWIEAHPEGFGDKSEAQ